MLMFTVLLVQWTFQDRDAGLTVNRGIILLEFALGSEDGDDIPPLFPG